MTLDLQNRTKNAEDSSADLAHEIRNPLASLKGASELLESTPNKDERKKLIGILSHDVERIDRLITDYSKMLKDEASLSREKMKSLNLVDLINDVTEEFNNNNSYTIDDKDNQIENITLIKVLLKKDLMVERHIKFQIMS